MTVIMGRCDYCKLGFHTSPGTAFEGCKCLMAGCGCRVKREKK